MEQNYVGTMMQPMNFEVRAKAGSMLPENKEWVENKIMSLVQMGLITDPVWILDNIELPGKEKLMQTMLDQQAAQAQALEPMSDQEMADLGTDEDEILNRLQSDPNMVNRMPDQFNN